LKRSDYIFLRLMVAVMLLLTALAPAMAQNTVHVGQTTDLSVIPEPGDTYVWELYNDVTGINFAADPGNCPVTQAYFTGASTGSTVNVKWLASGIYFFKVTAYRGNCAMNLKVGKMEVLFDLPTAVIEPPPPICVGDSVHLAVQLTGTAPWSFTLTDGVNTFVYSNITTSTVNITVPMIPLVNTPYWITEVTDAYATNTTPSAQVVQIVKPKPVNSKIYHYGP
jgi:hypothetical protein